MINNRLNTKKLILTKDGSHSFFSSKFNESYHSKYGAVTEAKHVFIKNGLLNCNKKKIDILEIGFGTGLNTLLSLNTANAKNININYMTLEQYPLSHNEYKQLNYSSIIDVDKYHYNKINESEWEKNIFINRKFSLTKKKILLEEFETEKKFDIVYFDAFSPEKQPELWTEKIFIKIYNFLKPNGFMVTYCSKGIVKRRLAKVGFKVNVLKGPPGKREMLKANQK